MSKLTDAVLNVFITFPTDELSIPDVKDLGNFSEGNSVNGAISKLVKEGLLVRTIRTRGKSGFSKWKMVDSKRKIPSSFTPLTNTKPIEKVGSTVVKSKKPTLINRCYYLAMAKRHLCIEDICDTFNISILEAFNLIVAVHVQYEQEVKVNMSLDIKH